MIPVQEISGRVKKPPAPSNATHHLRFLFQDFSGSAGDGAGEERPWAAKHKTTVIQLDRTPVDGV